MLCTLFDGCALAFMLLLELFCLLEFLIFYVYGRGLARVYDWRGILNETNEQTSSSGWQVKKIFAL